MRQKRCFQVQIPQNCHKRPKESKYHFAAKSSTLVPNSLPKSCSCSRRWNLLNVFQLTCTIQIFLGFKNRLYGIIWCFLMVHFVCYQTFQNNHTKCFQTLAINSFCIFFSIRNRWSKNSRSPCEIICFGQMSHCLTLWAHTTFFWTITHSF